LCPAAAPLLHLAANTESLVNVSAFPNSNDPIGVRIVAAIGRRGEVGLDNKLLFRLKADMANFRRITARTPLVMGRKTWESFPKRPLPGRPNVVASRNPDFQAPGGFVFSSVATALAAARAMAAKAGVGEVSLIGGGEIWAAGFDAVTHMTLTEIDAEREADAFFPEFDRAAWREVSAQRFEKDADNEVPFTIREFERRV
jgi:dihydrofolate reductase